ncbi:lipocalin-like domain-containing protein [Hyalangium versicolor]|uniref:lipocalin-like domain-containing protein n=1 Tax=Hyalangium versicolor TaxID=2861190 RepID=UPI001CCD8D9C|nr:lipocalin-like domain-containing protein [Hyalangium versicolor]
MQWRNSTLDAVARPRRIAVAMAFVSVVLLASTPAPKPAPVLVTGTWDLVRVDNVQPDGTRVQLYGAHPQGRLVLDESGRYSIQIYREDRARFASKDKNAGTAEENRDAVQGCNTHFGTYSVSDGKTITFHIEHASFPNWEGTEQQRLFTLVGDVLTYTVPTPTTGTAASVGEVQWRRAASRNDR